MFIALGQSIWNLGKFTRHCFNSLMLHNSRLRSFEILCGSNLLERRGAPVLRRALTATDWITNERPHLHFVN